MAEDTLEWRVKSSGTQQTGQRGPAGPPGPPGPVETYIHASEHLTSGVDPIPKASGSADGLMSKEDKSKLDGVAVGANNYTHPASHPASMITQDANNRFVTDVEKSTWNNKASTDVATIITNGLMAATDKSKLDGIEVNANNYSHPTGDGYLHVPATGTTNNGKVLKAGATAGSAAWGNLAASEVGAVPTTDVVTTATANKILKLDANGKLPADVTGNAGTATKLATARTISLTGDATGSASFDGSSNVSIAAMLANSGVTAGTYTKVTVDAKGRVTSAAQQTAADIPTLTLAKISDAGTAASKNTGIASGNVPILGADGKLDTAVLPALAITDTFVVATQAAMLALTAQVGDVAVRTDLNKSFILKTEPASTLANWQELLTPTDVVLSVNGKTGTVTLGKADFGLGNVDDVKQAPAARVITAGNGLTGGGDLTADRTLALGTPSTLTPSTTNSATGTTHSHAVDTATQAEAEAGTSTAKFMTPERTKQAIAALQAVKSVAGRIGAVTLTKTDVGLSSVDNVQQATKAEFTTHDTDSTRHITAGERTAWNAKTAKYATAIGNGSATQFTVTHNLGSMDVTVTIRESAAPYEVVYTDVQIIDVDNIKILFGSAPSVNQYRVTVVG